MNLLAFGKGDFTDVCGRYLGGVGIRVIELSQADCDVRDHWLIARKITEHSPAWILNAAGVSDVGSVDPQRILDVNLMGAINVGDAAADREIPCIQIASTAGMQPGNHRWYGPAKAGVINYTRAMANRGHQAYAISPGRMDTRMRTNDFPDEDKQTRLDPIEAANVVLQIIDGYYRPGSNVVIRKVGMHRIDIYEDGGPQMPSMGL